MGFNYLKLHNYVKKYKTTLPREKIIVIKEIKSIIPKGASTNETPPRAQEGAAQVENLVNKVKITQLYQHI